jgi:hypothetical protein
VARALTPQLDAAAVTSASAQLPDAAAATAAALGMERLTDGVVCRPFQYTFKAPFEDVVAALAAKYRPPNDPENPFVREVVDVAPPREVPAGDGERAQLTTHKHREIVIALDFLPWPMRRLVAADELRVEEKWHLCRWRDDGCTGPAASADGVLHYAVTNRNLRAYGAFQELARYQPHPQRRDWTLYESLLELQGNTFVAKKVSGRGGRRPAGARSRAAALATRLRQMASRALNPPPLPFPHHHRHSAIAPPLQIVNSFNEDASSTLQPHIDILELRLRQLAAPPAVAGNAGDGTPLPPTSTGQ